MATKSIAWQTGSGNITLTYQGQGDGPITIQTDINNLGSARSQVITVETVGGAITRNFTISQAACPFPVGDVRNFSYTGSYQEVELPAGQYKLQCWGAQGGSNAAASSYGITAKAGGKGGYAEGIITLSQKTTVRVTVGGAGSSSAGGFNGGGSTTGSSTYNASNEQGVSRMGGGGGASDIRLSDGALLSRMIVAGGGAGGAMCYKQTIVPSPGSPTSYSSTGSSTFSSGWWEISALAGKVVEVYLSAGSVVPHVNNYQSVDYTLRSGSWVKMDFRNATAVRFYPSNISAGATMSYRIYSGLPTNVSVSKVSSISSASVGTFFTTDYTKIYYKDSANGAREYFPTNGAYNSWIGWPLSSTMTYIIGGYKYKWNSGSLVQQTTTSANTDYQVGGVGGGTQGGGYSTTYVGKQNAAGSGGAFGQGANQTTTGYRYCSGAGGGGWYGGGGGQKSDSSMTSCKYSGGGSGFVNTAASASNRPSGYTGLELDSGETKDGNTSFPNTAGTGNETGHSGDGYVKITRLA